jgi:replication-associated recombination protein RarA
MRLLTEYRKYDLGETISAVQKLIRRGMEWDAMYFVLELVPKYEAYLWKRLVVICLEDIGVASPDALLYVRACRESYFEFREDGRDGSARLALGNAILRMCRAGKTRIADEFQCAVNQRRLQNPDERRELPDFALDKHTAGGRRLGRGVDHWLTEGCLLHPEEQGLETYRETAAAYWRNTETFVQTKWGKKTRAVARQTSMFTAEEGDDSDD